jgi:REP element-mobilizing transposase RayT
LSNINLKVSPQVGGKPPVALGGVADHVHLLVSLPTTLAIADLVKAAKGGSAHLANHALDLSTAFKWQGGYGAFTVSQQNLTTVANYVRNQPVHHRQNTLIADLEISSTSD